MSLVPSESPCSFAVQQECRAVIVTIIGNKDNKKIIYLCVVNRKIVTYDPSA